MSSEVEFNRRKIEIEEYLSYLSHQETQAGMSVTLMNTMKSSALVMMYNLVESTMTNILQDVFDHLAANAVDFDALNEQMKELVLQYCKKKNPGKIVEKMTAQNANMVVASFDRSDIFSGNIDCKIIRETLKSFGVKAKGSYTEPALLTVKKERNSLAHGDLSFSDCGKQYSAKDLTEYHAKTCVILKRAITDFNGYLASGAYA